jgi:phage terminase large subunit-like protein
MLKKNYHNQKRVRRGTVRKGVEDGRERWQKEGGEMSKHEYSEGAARKNRCPGITSAEHSQGMVNEATKNLSRW